MTGTEDTFDSEAETKMTGGEEGWREKSCGGTFDFGSSLSDWKCKWLRRERGSFQRRREENMLCILFTWCAGRISECERCQDTWSPLYRTRWCCWGLFGKKKRTRKKTSQFAARRSLVQNNGCFFSRPLKSLYYANLHVFWWIYVHLCKKKHTLSCTNVQRLLSAVKVHCVSSSSCPLNQQDRFKTVGLSFPWI